MTRTQSIPTRRTRPGSAFRTARTASALLAAMVGLVVAGARVRATITNETVVAAGVSTNPPAAEAPTPAPAAGTNEVSKPGPDASDVPSERANPASEVLATDYAAFKLIRERNIFNANRSRRSSRDRGSETRPPRVETLSLVGTMSHARGAVAFFDGSESGYRKAVKPDGTIAGYKLIDVAPSSVKLEKEGKTVELSIGGLMKRREGDPWEVIAPVRSTGDGAVSTAAEKEILERLLKKREEDGEGAPEAAPAAPAPKPAEPEKAAAPGAASDADGGNEVLRRLQQKRNED